MRSINKFVALAGVTLISAACGSSSPTSTTSGGENLELTLDTCSAQCPDGDGTCTVTGGGQQQLVLADSCVVHNALVTAGCQDNENYGLPECQVGLASATSLTPPGACGYVCSSGYCALYLNRVYVKTWAQTAVLALPGCEETTNGDCEDTGACWVHAPPSGNCEGKPGPYGEPDDACGWQ